MATGKLGHYKCDIDFSCGSGNCWWDWATLAEECDIWSKMLVS